MGCMPRTKFVHRLPLTPFRAFIAFGIRCSFGHYPDSHCSVVLSLLHHPHPGPIAAGWWVVCSACGEFIVMPCIVNAKLRFLFSLFPHPMMFLMITNQLLPPQNSHSAPSYSDPNHPLPTHSGVAIHSFLFDCFLCVIAESHSSRSRRPGQRKGMRMWMQQDERERDSGRYLFAFVCGRQQTH